MRVADEPRLAEESQLVRATRVFEERTPASNPPREAFKIVTTSESSAVQS